MNKLSWPYIGSAEHEMASLSPKGDPDKDIAPIVNDGSKEKNYGTFNDSLSAGGEDTYDNGHEYSGGVFFPLHEDIRDLEEAEFEQLSLMSNAFITKLKKNATILTWGKQSDKMLSPIRSIGINIISLAKEKRQDINLNSFASVDSDLMFYNHRTKCDGFFNSMPFDSLEESEICIRNVYANLKPKSFAMLIASKNLDIEKMAIKAGFKVISKHSGLLEKILVKKNSLNNKALVKHYSKDNDSFSSFICNIAETNSDKAMGLQSYSKLADNCGLLFRYDKPESLTFHMGSVKFPIDIAFMDENNIIKKIYSNIQPGSLDLFTCANSKNVLEVCGGAAEALGMSIGDRIFIDYDESSIEKQSAILNDLGLYSCIVKTSSLIDSSLQSYGNFSILNKNPNDSRLKTNIIKKASIEQDEKIAIFNLNDFITDDVIPFYRKSSIEGEGSLFSLSLFSESFLTSGDLIKVSLNKLYENNFYKNIRKNYLPNLSDLIYITSKNNSGLLNKIKRYIKEDYKIAFVYSGNYDSDLIKEAIEVGLNSGYTGGATINLSDAECIKIPSNYGYENIVQAASDRYRHTNFDIVLGQIEKTAGVPVDNETKAVAKKCMNYLDRAKKYAAKLKDNLEQNLSVYERLVEKPAVIKNSAGEYSESSKRNSKVCKKVLLNIKESISLLNSIQDISTTEEVIGSLADLSKVFSASSLEVFDLINVIDSGEFTSKLGESTGKVSGAADDLIITIDRTKAYITKDILGIIILSE